MIALQTEGLPPLDESIRNADSKKLSILELGCGCGMVGISIAQTVPDCQVFLTDMSEAQDIAKRNIAAMKNAASSSAVFSPLNWGADLPQMIKNQTFDVVLVCECTYNTVTIPALVQTLCAVGQLSPQVLVLVATKIRHSSESLFFEMMDETAFGRVSHTKLPLPRSNDFEDLEEVNVSIFRRSIVS